MKKDELYKKFTHYEALDKNSSTHAERVEIYRLMQRAGIHVPEDTDERLKKGKFPFNCDFFISKHPTASIIKWIPTRSPEKKGKFLYRDAQYFLDMLAGVTKSGVVIDPTNNTLEEQMKHIGAVMMKSRDNKVDKIVDVLAEEAKLPIFGHAYDDEPISFTIHAIPEPPDTYEEMIRANEEEDDLPF